MQSSSSRAELCAPSSWADEEELQELRGGNEGRPVRQEQAPTAIGFVIAEAWRLARESPQNCAAVCILLMLSIGVIAWSCARDLRRDWQACDDNTVMAKHFYCFNISAPPGVHRSLLELARGPHDENLH
jgi:hypothetical protein|mmetsp:Transcript_69922/g.155836  ORF Transcript_69922/g.155836 Transcript_69922/m.155836 type:complete len:129 (-) Transcript_69922:540-926(-)